MFRPKDPIDWHGFWADLLQGMGTGLLTYDDSPLAQAALAGLAEFDAAQARRNRREANPDAGAPGSANGPEETRLWENMTPAELAAYRRASPEQREALRQEMAEIDARDGFGDARDGATEGGGMFHFPEALLEGDPALMRHRPLSANPFDAWAPGAILPFGRDGRLKLPAYRR